LQAAISSKKLQLAGAGGIGGEKIKAEIAGLESQLGGLSNAAKGVSPALLVAGAGAIALGVGLAVGAGAALKFSNEIDRNRQQLTLFTKNVEATNEIIAQLKVTADATSLGLPGLLEATKTLAAYGVSAKNAGTATKMLGDLALGDSEKLQRFAVNLGQISSIGKAYTVDLKQFAMAGIPIFEALSKVMGKSTSEVLKLAEQGQVTYPIVVKAIAELTKEGASFFNGAEKGGTDLDRSLNQLTGAFENLQTIIGTAVGPAAVTAVLTLKDALDGVLLIIKSLSNEFKYFSGLISENNFGNAIVNEFKFVKKYLEQNPILTQALDPLNKVLNPAGAVIDTFAQVGKFQKKDAGGTTSNSEEAARQKYLADIAKQNTADVLADKLKKETEINGKIAKINKDTELQLNNSRLDYERQIADFRESTLRRIADMERTLQDQRIKANFDLQQSQLKLAGKAQYGKDTSAMIAAAATGQDTTMLSAARDSAKSLNDAAVTRRQIEFDSTMKKIQLERTLTDFKKGIEREIGEMQKSYARQTSDILTTAGTNIQSAMIKGAKEVEAILMRLGTGMSPPLAPELPVANSQFVRRANDQPNQQANSAAAGVGMIISPSMTQPRAVTQGPPGMRAMVPGAQSMQVDAVNNIRQFSPATAKLDQDTNVLKNQETQAKINQILDQQVTKTNELKDATFQVTEQSMAGLKTSIEKSQADQRTLDLIVSGTNPALAAQFVQNEQLNAQNTLKLEAQQASVQKTLEEKGLTAETVFERQNLVSQLDEQIARQPQILEGLNQQAVKQKEINDATARRSVIPNFIASAQTQLKDLESVAVRVSQGIGDAVGNSLTKGVQGLIEGTATAQQVFADFLKTVGDILMQEGAKMIATYTAIAIARSLAGLFGGGGGGGGAQGFQMPEIAPGVGSLGPQKIFGFAAGGNPPVGKASLVGEKGPELFVPSAAGTIIPAGPTAGIREVMANGNGGNATAPILNMSFETTRFGNTDYVSREQLEAAMMQTRAEATKAGARRGMTMTLDKLQQSPSTRSRVGLG